MKKLYCLGVLFLGISATISIRAESSALHGGAMLTCSGMPCVDITTKDGKHLRMLVSLGDANSIVDSTTAKNLGLTADPASTTENTGRSLSGGEHSVLADVRMGNASLGDVPVIVTDMTSSIQKKELPQADGILAYSAFRDRLLEINYKNQTVRVSEPLTTSQPCPGFCGNVSDLKVGQTASPSLVTTGFSVNGKPILARIDTLFPGTILIYPKAVSKLDLQAENSSARPQALNFTPAGTSLRESQAHTESFGSKALAHNSALFFDAPQGQLANGDFDGTVGAGLFAGHVLYLDLHAQHFWITN